MIKQKLGLLNVAYILALVFLIAPVAADTLAINAGNGQSATVGTTVTTPPSVILTYTNASPMSGMDVTFTVTSGGGSVTPSTVTTDANGVATVSSWTLGTTVGTNNNILTVTSGSLTPVTFMATGMSATTPPTISTVAPSSGINNGLISDVVITGTNYGDSTTVVLMKSGYSNISMANAVVTTTTVTGAFQLNGAAAGTWDVVLISNGGTVVKSAGFTVVSATAATVTAVSPVSATTNTTVSATFTGTGFQSNARMRLARVNYNDVLGTISSYSSTSLVGTFDLTNQDPGTYTACVLYDGTNRVCGPSFTVNSATAVNGSIYFTSSPSGAVVYVDYIEKGNTPLTVYNVTPGLHNIKLQRALYKDWTDQVTITAGNQSSVAATMKAADVSTTVQTTVPVVITTATLPPTKVKSTAKTPTPWPTATATPESPLDPLVIVGAVGIGMFVIRKH
jgi:hypothetical protein